MALSAASTVGAQALGGVGTFSAALVALAGSAASAQLFPAQLELSSLNGANGFILNGIDADDRSGGSVSSAGDVNGDGVDDLIIGANYANPNGNSFAGESYVVFGGAGVGSTGVIELSSLNGSNGFTLNGIDTNDTSGGSVSSAGDVNGDGIDDLIIGAQRADPNGINYAGESYVIFGGAGVGSTGVIELSSLNGSNGFVVNGIDTSDTSGISVSTAGDVNGDGIDDLIIGAYLAAPNGIGGAGESYVVFGGVGVGATGVFELSSLNGANGFVLNGVDANDISGTSVSSAGDVNGDGVDDLIIGADDADPNGIGRAGESYVVFGGAGVGSTGVFELSSLNGANGFVLNGVDVNDRSGDSVSSAGDVNGDGVDDLIIGAFNADPNGNLSAGESYVVFGGVGVGATGVFELSSLNGANGFVLNGVDDSDLSGTSVSSAGDINGDGVDDLIIGAINVDPNGNLNAGKSYVVFGGAGVGASGVIELSSLNGANGFDLNGIDAFDRSGVSVSSAGDVNGDGVDDLIIGASYADPNGISDAGESYVVFGRAENVWTAPAGGEFDTAANWLGGSVPSGGVVVMEPQVGAVIGGPAASAAMSTLRIGAEFGRTVFDMKAGSLVTVEEAVTLPASAGISGSGVLFADAGVTNNGLMDPTNLTMIASAGVTNNAELRLESFSRGSAGSEFEVFGSLNNAASGVIFIHGSATLASSGGLINDGAVDFTNANAIIRGDVNNGGGITGSAASIIVLTDTLTNDAEFVLATDSALSVLGDLTGNGVTGPGGGPGGTVFIGGTFTPARAMATGVASFGGDLSLGVNSATLIELSSDADFDRVTSLGAVNVSGDLTVTLLGGYSPQAGDSFTIVSAAGVNGVFATENLPALTKGLEWGVTYAPSEIVLTILGGCVGDLNGDNVIDSADLAILLAAWGGSGDADLDSSGVVDSGDLAILLAAWGGCK